MERKKRSIAVSDSLGNISALVDEPGTPQAVLVLAHGAGANMEHRFLERLAEELANRDVVTVRFNFPYTENGKKRPDPPAIAEKTVAAVIEKTHEWYPRLPLVAGGKSFGGRMTSQRLSKECPVFVKGIVFYGFPLHPTGSPSIERAGHLSGIRVPMLFLQGTRDTLAELSLLEKVCAQLPTARLEKFEGADHSFKRGKEDNIPRLADLTREWIRDCSI
jgi:predicted alpha/beta-hydrolase family hydrolase